MQPSAHTRERDIFTLRKAVLVAIFKCKKHAGLQIYARLLGTFCGWWRAYAPRKFTAKSSPSRKRLSYGYGASFFTIAAAETLSRSIKLVEPLGKSTGLDGTRSTFAARHPRRAPSRNYKISGRQERSVQTLVNSGYDVSVDLLRDRSCRICVV